MLKRNNPLYLSLIAVILPVLAQAQQFTFSNSDSKTVLKDPQPVVGQVFYDFTYISDTSHPDKPTKEIMELDYSKGYSKFTSVTYSQNNIAMKSALDKQMAGQVDPSNIKLTLPDIGFMGTAETIFSTSKEMYEFKNHIMNVYLIKDQAKPIDWQMEDSTKVIGSYTCQKATGSSHGRHYTAWFTTDLPYSFGPRKLSGLPGLVLEAYDDKKEVTYIFNHIVTDGNGSEIGLPEKGIPSTAAEFKQMQDAFKANPQAAMQGSAGAPPPGAVTSGMQIKTMSIVTTDGGGAKKTQRKINNPIELTAD